MDLDREKLSRFLEKNYGLHVKSMKKLYAYSDINLRVRTHNQGDYFLKLHKQDGKAKIGLLADTLSHLNNSGVPVAKVQAAKKGDLVFNFDGMTGILQEFVSASEVTYISAKTAYELGQTMGRMHRATSEQDPKDFGILQRRYPWNAEHFDLVLEHFGEQKDKMPADVRKIIENLAEEWKAAQKGLKKCRRGFVHNDFNDSNVLLKQGRIAAVIDFSEAVYSWYLSDIATAMKYMFLPTKSRWNKINDFMAGYRSEFRILERELKHIPLLIKIRAAMSLTENLSDHGSYYVYSAYVLRRLNEPKTLRQIFNRMKPPSVRKPASNGQKVSGLKLR